MTKIAKLQNASEAKAKKEITKSADEKTIFVPIGMNGKELEKELDKNLSSDEKAEKELTHAEKLAKKIEADAKAKIEKILADAQAKADKIKADALQKSALKAIEEKEKAEREAKAKEEAEKLEAEKAAKLAELTKLFEEAKEAKQKADAEYNAILAQINQLNKKTKSSGTSSEKSGNKKDGIISAMIEFILSFGNQGTEKKIVADYLYELFPNHSKESLLNTLAHIKYMPSVQKKYMISYDNKNVSAIEL